MSGTLYFADIEKAGVEVYSDGKAEISSSLVGEGRLVIILPGSADKPIADESNPVTIGGGMQRAMADIATTAENLKLISDAVACQMDMTSERTILGKVYAITDQLNQTAVDIRRELNSQMDGTLISTIRRSAENVHAATDDLREITAAAKPKIDRTFTDVEQAVAKLNAYVNEDVGVIVAALKQASEKIAPIMDNLDVLSSSTRQLIQTNQPGIDEVVDNMMLVSADLKATAREVRRNPWRLLYRPDEEEARLANLYDAARAYSSAAEQLDTAISRLDRLSESSDADDELLEVRREMLDSLDKFKDAQDVLWKELKK